MTCACGNTARYVSETGDLTCGICPLVHGHDAIRIRDVPALLKWSRRIAGDSELRSIIGRHPGELNGA